MSTTPVAAFNLTADGLVNAGEPKRFHGFQITAAAAAEVEIRDGSVTGTILAKARLAAAGEQPPTPLFIERGVQTAGGIWVEVVSGTPTVVVYAA